MSKEAAIEMFVGGLVLDPTTQAPVVVLKNERGDIHIPIWIGIAEATSIASALKDLPMARPLTHDLMFNVFNQIGISVDRVVITELKDSTYYAELILSQGDRVLIMDSRPSDAIAMALRAAAPIFVAEQVLEQAKMSFAVVSSGQEEDGRSDEELQSTENAGGEEESSEQEGKDFRQIDKDKWRQILEELDPEDFKFKM